jgi:hypothetical protein
MPPVIRDWFPLARSEEDRLDRLRAEQRARRERQQAETDRLAQARYLANQQYALAQQRLDLDRQALAAKIRLAEQAQLQEAADEG